MMLALAPALAVKLLVWGLALAVFLRASARSLGEVDAERRQHLCAGLLGALAGSKVMHVLGHSWGFAWDDLSTADVILHWVGGDSLIGGVLGARMALWLADRRGRGEPLAAALVLPAASALLVLCLGEFFWALRGQSYGAPTSMPWGMNFGDGVSRHPVMLYEAVFFALVLWSSRRNRGLPAPGGAWRSIFGLCVAWLLLGYLKPPYALPLLREAVQPPLRVYAGVMTAEQWLCACAMLVCLPGLVVAVRREAA